jgi:hypothetical protein
MRKPKPDIRGPQESNVTASTSLRRGRPTWESSFRLKIHTKPFTAINSRPTKSATFRNSQLRPPLNGVETDWKRSGERCPMHGPWIHRCPATSESSNHADSPTPPLPRSSTERSCFQRISCAKMAWSQ